MEPFPARYDRLTQVITIGATAVFVAGAFLLWWKLPLPAGQKFAVGLLPLLILFLSYLYAPQGFSVAPDGLRIHRLRGAIVVPLAEIRSARRVPPEALGGIRTFGSGGLFGFYGRFYSSRFGHYRAYVTSRRNLVVVEANRVYLLSPDRPEEFLHHLSQWAPGLETQPSD